MANYYTELCFGIALHTSAERSWWTQEINGISPDHPLGLVVTMTDTGLILSGRETPNIQLLAELIRRFLSENNINEAVAFQWALTCDKARTNAFGGGACLVTRHEIRIRTTEQWVNSTLEMLDPITGTPPNGRKRWRHE